MLIRRALPGLLGLLAVMILACGLFGTPGTSPTAIPTQAPRDTATPRPPQCYGAGRDGQSAIRSYTLPVR
jgi:hypothetical protein